MIKRLFIIFISAFLLFNSVPAYSKDISKKSIEKYINKISSKFSRTYCNTSQFGISNVGALEFAVGETNKEFKNNKLNNLLDYSLLRNKIIDNLQNNCQAYDFPIKELENLKFN